MDVNSQIERYKNKKAVIGVLGLGYVGLPLILRFVEVGFKVIGFDIDQSKIDKLNKGESYIAHIPSDKILQATQAGFKATANFSTTTECDALIICVPTPLNKYREPDLSFVEKTTQQIAPYLRKGQLVSLESTTYPGTTDELVLPILNQKGLNVGRDFFLVFSPEREDPGNAHFGTKTTPKVCGGITAECLAIGKAMYEQIIDKVVPVSSTRAAEMTKLLENIHRSVNIGLVNEMKIVADKMGIDIHEVIRAAATKPFGFTPYFPGPGLGGHCIPIDPFYLTWKAREYGVNTKFIELAGEINTSMPNWVVSKVGYALNGQKKSVKDSKVLILGIAYKKNIDDCRESPAFEVMKQLSQLGAKISYSDPFIPEIPHNEHFYLPLKSVALSPSSLAGFDCVILITDHQKFDYEMIKQSSQLIVDTRGIYGSISDKIIKA